jgi:hypothetical protein
VVERFLLKILQMILRNGMTSLPGTFKALWERAPLWRFAIMTSLLLTLLFVLFPPTGQQKDVPPETISTQATYKSQSAVNDASISKAPNLPSHSATINNTLHNQPATAALSQPKTAAISLAIPGKGDQDQNQTGLNEAMMGRVYTGSIPVSGFTLPLPEGNWAMLANSSIHYKDNSGMSYFLGKIENKRLTGMVTVYALKATPPSVIDASWPMVNWSGCSRTNALFMSKEPPDNNGLDSCWYIYNFFTPNMEKWADRAVAMNSIVRAAAGDLAAKGVTYPQDFISVEFSRISNWGFLYAIYMFSTEVEGMKSSEALAYPDSDWAPNNISRFPEKEAYLEKIKQWGNMFLPRIKEAFNRGYENIGTAGQQSGVLKTIPGEDSNNAAVKTKKQADVQDTPSVNGVGLFVEGIPVKIGDTLEDVKQALHTNQEPQALKTTNPDIAPVSLMHAETQGIWAFFQNDKVVIIRLSAPFSGNISGIKIGDSSSKIEKILGPAKHEPAGKSLNYSYDFSSLPTVRFVVSQNNNQIEGIILQEKEISASAGKDGQRQVFSNDSFPSQSSEETEASSVCGGGSPQNHYIAVAVTKVNLEFELKKCVPEIVMNDNLRNDIQNFPFPANTIKTFGHVKSCKKFVLHETTGVCLQKSSKNFAVFAADEFIDTVSPKGLSPDVVEEWYKKIAIVIATKGRAKIAYVFSNGNATIADYWVESNPDYVLFYSSVFKKAGEWETDTLDLKFSNPSMTSVTETKRSGISQKKFPLAH